MSLSGLAGPTTAASAVFDFSDTGGKNVAPIEARLVQ
jgi:hypothetical protein